MGQLQVARNNGALPLRRVHLRRVHKLVSTMSRDANVALYCNSPINDAFVASIKCRNVIEMTFTSRVIVTSRYDV